MKLEAQLEQLLARAVEALRLVPGAVALHLHGSRAGNEADEFADIDLEVLTVDVHKSRCVWPQLLELIGPIDVALPLRPGEQNTAFSVSIRGESPYHKIDISLQDGGRQTPPADWTPTVELWSQTPAPPITDLPPTEAYVPGTETCGYLLVDGLMGGVRYAKARRRGHHLTCWRFLRGMLDRLLLVMYTQQQSCRSHATLLTTWEYRALDTAMSPTTRAGMLSHLDWSNRRGMDNGCLWSADQIAALLMEQAAQKGEEIPPAPIGRLLGFLHDELGTG